MDDDNRFLPPALPWRGRLAVLSRQLTRGGAGARAAGGESSGTIAAAPTFSSNSTSSAPPPVSVVVLGGCVMDVVATPSPGFALSPGGSVPGSVSLTPGGVGRNIAAALAGLLLPPPATPTTPRSHLLSPPPPPPRVSIVSVVGADPAGDALVSNLERAGVDASGVGRLGPSSLRGSGGGGGAATTAAAAGTPVVVAVHDGGTGDVACSVADVATVERCFTPDVVRRELSRIAERESGRDSVTVIVVDGNLSAAAVAAAASASASSSSPPGIALFEPVSVAKGVRAVREGGLRCRVMTPNAAELLAMARAAVEGGGGGGGGGTAPTPPERSTSLTSTSTPGSLLRLGDADVNKKDLDSFLRSTLFPAARALISRGVCEFVLVTLGEQGAALIGRETGMAPPLRERTDAAGLLFAAPATRRKDDDSNLKLAACVVPAAPVPGGVVSTGGAGDAFAAGFLAAACRGARSGKESEEARTAAAATTATIAFALAAGAAAAAQVVSSPLSSPALDAERVWACAREVERQARFVVTL